MAWAEIAMSGRHEIIIEWELTARHEPQPSLEMITPTEPLYCMAWLQVQRSMQYQKYIFMA